MSTAHTRDQEPQVGYVEAGRYADHLVMAFQDADVGGWAVDVLPPMHKIVELEQLATSIDGIGRLEDLLEAVGGPVRWLDASSAQTVRLRYEWETEQPATLNRQQTTQIAKQPRADRAALERAGASSPHRPVDQQRWPTLWAGTTDTGGWVVAISGHSTGLFGSIQHGKVFHLQVFDPATAARRDPGAVAVPGTGRWRPPSVRALTRNADDALHWLAGQQLSIDWLPYERAIVSVIEQIPRAVWPSGPLPVEPEVERAGWNG